MQHLKSNNIIKVSKGFMERCFMRFEDYFLYDGENNSTKNNEL